MLEWASRNVGYISTIIGGMGILLGLILKPIRAILKETKAQTDKLESLDRDMGDMLCSLLTREHDFFVDRGFCPSADKQRISAIYARYKLRGRNHLADHYMDDVLNLPNSLGVK